MKSVAVFILGMLTAVCIQGRSQVGNSHASFGHDHANRWVVLSGLAKHLDGGIHCNSTTSGLGVEINDYSAGFYRNSNCEYSLYAAKAWLPLRFAGLEGVRSGFMAGAVTGYGAAVLPVAGLAATYEGKAYGVNVLFVPPYKDSGNVIWVTFKRRF